MNRSFHQYAAGMLLIIVGLGVAIGGCTSSAPVVQTPSSSPTPVPVVATTPGSTPEMTMTTALPSASATVSSGNSQTVPPATTVPASSGGGQTVQVTLTAENYLFDQKTITVPAGSTVIMTFINKDATIPHNFAVYTSSTATKKIFSGDLITGPATTTYTFTAPSGPGNYFFRCDVHPTVMFGTFVVT